MERDQICDKWKLCDHLLIGLFYAESKRESTPPVSKSLTQKHERGLELWQSFGFAGWYLSCPWLYREF